MNRIAPLALAFLTALTACDFELAPATAEGAGVHPARVAIFMGSELSEPPPEVTTVEVEIFDLRVHRASDDTWIMLVPEAVRVDVTADHEAPAHPGIPLRPDHYDAIELVIGGVYVTSGETWSEAQLDRDEYAAHVSWSIEGHTMLEVRFDLAAALHGSPQTGWRFTPALSATLNGRR